jgi:hypothetical protein
VIKSRFIRRHPRMSPIALCLSVAMFLAATSFAHPTARAGFAPAVLTCKSVLRAGAVTLSGEIPGDYETFSLKIKNGKEEHELKSLNAIDRDMDPELRAKLEESGVIANDRVITVVEDFKRGIFTMTLRRTDVYDLRLYALPSTIQSRISPNSKKASFEAMMLEGDGYPNWNKAVRMRCTYDHSI